MGLGFFLEESGRVISSSCAHRGACHALVMTSEQLIKCRYSLPARQDCLSREREREKNRRSLGASHRACGTPLGLAAANRFADGGVLLCSL